MTRTVSLVIFWLLTIAAGDAMAKVVEAAVPLDVPSGTWKSVRLKSIPVGTTMTLKVTTDGPVRILLLEEADYARFPDPRRPAFRGKTSDSITATVQAPGSGDYYVVVDNRSGEALREVEVAVRGETASRVGTGGDLPSDPNPSSDLNLSDFQTRLRELFEFEPVPMGFGPCSPGRSIEEVSGRVLLCEAYTRGVFEEFADRGRTQDAMLFLLFHEMGHQLLGQWDHPGHAGEATADEFAVVLMRILGREERVRLQAAFMRENAARFAALAEAFPGDSHAVSAARARNLVRMANDPGLLGRWQPILVPRMQTSVLKRLEEQPLPWTNSAAVEDELARRR